jgi:diacylglycerol kinase family enzyme
VATIAAGEQRAVDVGEVNNVIFVNNSSIGFYPYLVLERERRKRRKRLSKWIAMMLALPRVLRNLPLFRLTILVEGNVEPCRSPCVFVGNNEYRITVPGFGMRDRLDKGELCLYVARTQGRLSMFWLACRCILGLVRQQRDLRVFKGATADISARRSRLLVAFDGEVATMRSQDPTESSARVRSGDLIRGKLKAGALISGMTGSFPKHAGLASRSACVDDDQRVNHGVSLHVLSLQPVRF